MKLVINIVRVVFLLLIWSSCTEGGEQGSGSSEVYTVTASLSKVAEKDTEARGYVKGIYDRGLNTLNLDINWESLLDKNDALEQICIYRHIEGDGNSDIQVRTINYSSTATNGNTTLVLSGYKGLRMEEINDFLSGKWNIVLCTSGYPDGVIGGKLETNIQGDPGTVYVSEFTLPDETEFPIRLELGESKKIRIVVQPYYAENTSYKVISSDPKVFTVTQDDVIHTVGIGEAKLIIVALDEKGNQNEFDIIISSTDLVSQIIFEPLEDPTIIVGESRQIVPKVLPESALNKVLKYVSSDPSIIEVDNEGNLTAYQPGKVTITASSTDGSLIVSSYEIEAVILEEIDRNSWVAGSDDYADRLPEYAIDGDPATCWMNKTWTTGKSLWFTFEPTPVYRIEIDRLIDGAVRPDGFCLDYSTRTVEVYVTPSSTSVEKLAGTIEYGENTTVIDPTRTLLLDGEVIQKIRLKMTRSNGLSSSSLNRYRISEVRAFLKK